MHRNISISSFKKLPAGLILVSALFIMTESLLYPVRPGLIKDYWNKFLINEHELIELPIDYDYLIMGDSLQKTGIDPTLVDDRVLNLGLPGAKPMGQYLLLKRYLKLHKAPKVVFLFVDPEYEYDSLFVILRYFVNPREFASLWRDLTWEERMVFLFRYWVSLDTRKVGLTMRDEYEGDNNSFIKEMKDKRGFMPSPRSDKAIAGDHFAFNKKRYAEKISISDRDMKYLDKFVALAQSHDIRVVLLGHLLPKGLHDVFEKSGFNSDYLAFLDRLKKRYDSVYFVEVPILYLENSFFGDTSHVNREGVKLYSEYFRKKVFNSHL